MLFIYLKNKKFWKLKLKLKVGGKNKRLGEVNQRNKLLDFNFMEVANMHIIYLNAKKKINKKIKFITCFNGANKLV